MSCSIKVLSLIIIIIFINFKINEIGEKYYFLSEFFGNISDIKDIYFNFNKKNIYYYKSIILVKYIELD